MRGRKPVLHLPAIRSGVTIVTIAFVESSTNPASHLNASKLRGTGIASPSVRIPAK
jgi:hypothetical protein